MVTHRSLTDVRWVESDPSNLSGKTSSTQNKDSFTLLWSSNSRHSPYGPKGKVGISNTSARLKGGRCQKQKSQFTGSSDNKFIKCLVQKATISLENNKNVDMLIHFYCVYWLYTYEKWILHNANAFSHLRTPFPVISCHPLSSNDSSHHLLVYIL